MAVGILAEDQTWYSKGVALYNATLTVRQQTGARARARARLLCSGLLPAPARISAGRPAPGRPACRRLRRRARLGQRARPSHPCVYKYGTPVPQDYFKWGRGAWAPGRIIGESTETLRDIYHFEFGLGSLVQVAETAWAQNEGGSRGAAGAVVCMPSFVGRLHTRWVRLRYLRPPPKAHQPPEPTRAPDPTRTPTD